MTEELLTDYSRDIETKNKNVLISSEQIIDLDDKVKIYFLINNYQKISNNEIVENIQNIIPEFNSMNSLYSRL